METLCTVKASLVESVMQFGIVSLRNQIRTLRTTIMMTALIVVMIETVAIVLPITDGAITIGITIAIETSTPDWEL
jgi:ABC-type Co2+ transport system permease subunit